MAADRSMVYEFVSEAKEHLANVTDDLLALEKAHEEQLRYRIDRLFRAMHSVKGGAGFFAFHNITELAHLMETLLKRLREQGLRPEETHLDALLGGADLILTLLDDVERSNQVDITPVRERLKRLVSGAMAQLTHGAELIERPSREGSRLYSIRCDLEAFCKSRQQPPLALVKSLLAFGSILDGRLEVPNADLRKGLPQGPIVYLATYSSSLDLEPLCEAVGLTSEQILPMPASVEDRAARPADDVAMATPQFVSASLISGAEPARKDDRVNSLRINVALLDRLMNLAGELVLVRNQALQAIDSTEPTVRRIVQRLNTITSELQDAVMRTRMQPVGNIFNKFPRIVRDLARSLGKAIEIAITGQEVELDKSIIETLSDPMTHLIRNCCDHGIETPVERTRDGKPEMGTITLRARHEGSQIHIEIRDDGRGIDPEKIRSKAAQMGLKTTEELAAMRPREVLSLILLPGFSTAERVTDLSGRGVGLDVVQTNVDQLGGALEIESTIGVGTTISLRLPLTMAIVPCLLVGAGEDRFAIPQKDLEELVCLFPDHSSDKIEYAFDQEVFRLRDRLLPLVRLQEVLDHRQPFNPFVKAAIVQKYHREARNSGARKRPVADAPARPGAPIFIAVVKAGRHRYGLIVDQILNTEEVVIKPMQSSMKALRCYSGATIMGDGRVALILDLEGVARHAAVSFDLAVQQQPVRASAEDEIQERDVQKALVFQYGDQEQFAMALAMIRRVVGIQTSQLEKVGAKEFINIDGVSTRVLRLDQFLHGREDGGEESLSDVPEMHLLLPRNVRKPVGLLMTRIFQTVSLPLQLDTDTYPDDAVLGSVYVEGRLTLVLDVFRLVDRIDGHAVASRSLLAGGESSLAGRRVLLVEDTQFFRLLVKGYLESQGFEVVTAVNGAAGLETLEQEPFDLVVSDIEMPVMDGWTFARSVRQRPELRDLPMLALSTLSSTADQVRAIECGFNSYEVKLDRDQLLLTIKRLLQ
jgi:two-component system, chemotaxis family, sensor kinase CheA